MKSKIRQLTLDEHKFRWRVVRESESQVRLRIWSVLNPRIPWVEVLLTSRDPWLRAGDHSDDAREIGDSEPITPRRVREIIEQIAADHGWPSEPIERRLYRADDRAFVRLSEPD